MKCVRYAAVMLIAVTAGPAFGQDPYGLLSRQTIVNPVGSGYYLYGTAAVIRAQAAAARSYKETQIRNEDLKQKVVETKKLESAATKWHLENDAYKADFLKRSQEEAYRIAMTEPTKGDIWSGYALEQLRIKMESNSPELSSDLTKLPPQLQGTGALAKRVTFTDGTYNSGSGLLTSDRIRWEGIFQDPYFKEEREKVESLMKEGFKAAQEGEMTRPYEQQLRVQMKKLDNKAFMVMQAEKQTGSFDPYPHNYARRQLGQIQESINFLGKPNLTESLFMKKNVEAQTVGQLVMLMRDRGWKFDKASDGNQAVYVALFNRMKEAMKGMPNK